MEATKLVNPTEVLSLQQKQAKLNEAKRKANLAKTLKAAAAAKQVVKSIKVEPIEKAKDGHNFPVTVKHGKDNFIVHYLADTVKDNLTSLVGGLIALFPQCFSFFVDYPLNKQVLNIPAASGGKGEKERVGNAFKKLAELLFAGMERDTVTSDKNKVAILETFRAKGFKFSCYSFAAVSEGIKIKMAKQIQEIALQRDLTRGIEANKVTILQTNTIKEVRKVVKEQGNEKAMLYIKSKQIAGLLPAIIES